MTRPRSELVSPPDTLYYHCVCRCVRRVFLCGEDRFLGTDYSHRKAWVLERLTLLGEVFTILDWFRSSLFLAFDFKGQPKGQPSLINSTGVPKTQQRTH
ncbi:hypothetical protein [Corallincola luteus]|uniref:hypothetical protein n=1 Tax=Corallincola luteus TaxID=1775177 RepID=UPI00196A359B|nr:hypothetical protein [Corallincola luteus]